MRLLGAYKNGNTFNRIYEDGTRICETKDDEFRFDFARNMDIKICDRCSMGCAWCHEGSTPNGKLANIMNEKFINTLHPFQEVALGGGNILEHPDLVPFLVKLKSKNIITNITVNQIHFEQNLDFISNLVDNKLVYGLGVSLVNPTYDFIDKAKRFPNLVIHVINGVVSEAQIERMSDKGLKILILGYKTIRRGDDFYYLNAYDIIKRKDYLKNNLSEIINCFDVVSFDNLAIEQLDVKDILSDKEWDKFYQGDDGTSTYYIDMVERKFARSSTAPFDKRYDLLDSVDEMFEVIKNEQY